MMAASQPMERMVRKGAGRLERGWWAGRISLALRSQGRETRALGMGMREA